MTTSENQEHLKFHEFYAAAYNYTGGNVSVSCQSLNQKDLFEIAYRKDDTRIVVDEALESYIEEEHEGLKFREATVINADNKPILKIVRRELETHCCASVPDYTFDITQLL